MKSRFAQSAGHSGWRGVTLLALLPVVLASFATAFWTHGAVRSVAGDVYCVAAVAVLVLAWKISFGKRDA